MRTSKNMRDATVSAKRPKQWATSWVSPLSPSAATESAARFIRSPIKRRQFRQTWRLQSRGKVDGSTMLLMVKAKNRRLPLRNAFRRWIRDQRRRELIADFVLTRSDELT